MPPQGLYLSDAIERSLGQSETPTNPSLSVCVGDSSEVSGQSTWRPPWSSTRLVGRGERTVRVRRDRAECTRPEVN